jgi:hypothetical protein
VYSSAVDVVKKVKIMSIVARFKKDFRVNRTYQSGIFRPKRPVDARKFGQIFKKRKNRSKK